MSDDSIFREVDEAIRQERLKSLWDKYGLFLVAAAVAIVVGVGGYKGWVYWKSEQAAAAGARFVGGLTQLQDGNTDEAREVFSSLAADGPSGYRLLSRLQLAAIHAGNGETSEAVRIYKDIASSSRGSEANRNLARIQAASLELNDVPFEEMLERLDDLTGTENPWRHSARELLGLSAYRNGKTDVAERYFNVMLTDRQTPSNMRRRAQMMLSLLAEADENPAPAPAANQ